MITENIIKEMEPKLVMIGFKNTSYTDWDGSSIDQITTDNGWMEFRISYKC